MSKLSGNHIYIHYMARQMGGIIMYRWGLYGDAESVVEYQKTKRDNLFYY